MRMDKSLLAVFILLVAVLAAEGNDSESNPYIDIPFKPVKTSVSNRVTEFRSSHTCIVCTCNIIYVVGRSHPGTRISG